MIGLGSFRSSADTAETSMTIEEVRKTVERIILSYLPAETGPDAYVKEAVNYSMYAGGKRVRPMLMYLTYKALGGDESSVIEPFIAAIEMIHTSSLIHDDLPAIDNDELRRGKETVHKAYGEAAGVLAGDLLMNMAYETAARAMSVYPQDGSVEKAFQILVEKTGAMLRGQSADVMLSGKELSDTEIGFIYENKTSALIEASLMIGAVLAFDISDNTGRSHRMNSAGGSMVSAMESAGSNLGMAFQVRDDILDVVGDSAELGKETGQDSRNSKQTYTAVHGIDDAGGYVEKNTETTLRIFKQYIEPVVKKGESRAAYELLCSLVEGLATRNS